MPVILAIQIAGESLFSVSSVFQELFSTKLSPRRQMQDNKLMSSYYSLYFHHGNNATSILTITKLTSSLQKPSSFLIDSLFSNSNLGPPLLPTLLPPTNTHACHHHESNLAQSSSYYCFKEFLKSIFYLLFHCPYPNSSPCHFNLRY